jgi:ADP-ribosylglycohydrolase
MDPKREREAVGKVDLADAKKRAEAGFIACCAGCILGKPLEINPTMELLQGAFEKIGEWPMRDYVSTRVLDHLPRRHPDWPETCRENIRWVAPDDDLNYTVLGMMMLEKFGLNFRREDFRQVWGENIPPFLSWGPERTMVIKNAMDTWGPGDHNIDLWVEVLNPEDEKCGAQIRPDAYGYACPGRPMLAAELAWRDASWTHRRTGIYATMFQAAVLALAHVEKDRLKIFEKALQYVPQRSRFCMLMKDALADVAAATDWLDGYRRLHRKLKAYGHCLIYFETATMMNTLRFASDVGDGICKQVMQGNDTDSYGARAGSMLGVYFGPGHLEERWIKQFNDRLHTTLASFHEQRLSEVARRMGELPGLVERALAGEKR